jgi:hypothetical protein
VLEIDIDPDRKLMTFRVVGEIDSARLTDLIIEGYKANRSAWTYRRIFDYRRATGLYDYGEVERLLVWWHGETAGMDICNKVAVITNEVLFEVRARVFDEAYTHGQIETFDRTFKALEWLDSVAPAESRP